MKIGAYCRIKVQKKNFLLDKEIILIFSALLTARIRIMQLRVLFLCGWISEQLANWSFFWTIGKLFFHEVFLMEFIICMYPNVVYDWTHGKPFIGGGAGYFIHDDRHTILRNDVLIVSRPSRRSKKKREVRRICRWTFLFVQWLSSKKMINYLYISKKLILGAFTSSSSFSNSSNLIGKISNMLFHYQM